MVTHIEARTKILTELISDDPGVRGDFLRHFRGKVEEFAEAMATAYLDWRLLSESVQGNTNKADITTVAYVAITLHVQSMKVFLLGLTVAAGNLMRQVLETIALAFLCSGKDHTIFKAVRRR